MAESKSGTNYGIIIAAVAVFISVGNSFWSIANPREDLKELKQDIKDLKGELTYFRDESRRNYTNKEENKTYREGLERLVGRIETKTAAIENDLRSVYSPKDAFNTLQGRIADFERSLRELIAKAASKPEVQINPQTNIK